MTRTTIDDRQDAIVAKLRKVQDDFNISAMHINTSGNYCELNVVISDTDWDCEYIRHAITRCSEVVGTYVPGAIYVCVHRGNPITGQRRLR